MRTICALCVILLLATNARAAPPADISPLLTPILEKHQIPGMVAVVVTATDGPIMLGAAGVRRAGTQDKVTPADRFHLGSCTKAITATLCAIVVEDGKLNWDSTPAAVWPNLKSKMNPDFANVTLAQLLHHRAGLPSDTAPDDAWRAMRQFRGTAPAARLKLVELALAKAPATPPGAQYVYSNTGYAIAAAMCEKVTAKPYETLMHERLFTPLGIRSAGFGPPGTAGKFDQPRGHNKADKPLEPGPGSDNPDAYNPAGRAHMSIEDWGKFVALHLQGAAGDTKLLKQSSFARLHEPVAGDATPYAMGWIVAPRPWANGPALNHAGTNTYWYAVTWLAPKRGFAVLVACNTGADPRAAKACDDAVGALIQKYLREQGK